MNAVLADTLLGLSPAQVGATVGLAGLLFAVIRWRQNTLRRRAAASRQEEAPAVTGRPVNMREVNAEIEALLAEVEETARRLTAQIDNRYTRLEQLLGEADEKIRRLEELARGTPVAAQPAASKVAVASAIPEAQRTLARLRQERGAPPAASDPAYQPIYSLADRGRNPREIAQELGRQPGEIELILALRQRA
ncbi:MAG TPA: hypothetical protein VHM90_00715 [Phycisphaerae bacterium]|nr:hypothetical protein [Phycisphaerae bacterium]